MDRAELEAKLIDLMASHLEIPKEQIKKDATFGDDLKVDSLGVVEMLMAVEDEFGITIPDEEAEKLTTVGEAIDLVASKLSL
ncbi:MAG: acyl carrier protein [Acidimicrobiia bacterium]